MNRAKIAAVGLILIFLFIAFCVLFFYFQLHLSIVTTELLGFRCTECPKCEGKCPQEVPVHEWLSRIKQEFGSQRQVQPDYPVRFFRKKVRSRANESLEARTS